MSSYSMVGNGYLGGSSNFLSLLGGIGDDWAYGLGQGMRMGSAVMDYNNKLATNPSHIRNQIAQNIANQGTAIGTHYLNSLDNQILSYLVGGGDPSDPRSPFRSIFAQNRLQQFVNNVPTPSNTPTNPVQMNSSGTPSMTNTNPNVKVVIGNEGQQVQQPSVIYNKGLG